MSNGEKIILGVLGVLVLILGVTSVLFYRKYSDIKENPQKYAQETVDTLVSDVKQLMILPEGEAPTIATVVDPQKLKDQAFFANAVTGDKVLIYARARKAILYSPATHKIIEVAPLNIGNPTGAPTTPTTDKTPATNSSTTQK